MFKLIRLAVYGLVGYALYTFVTDVMNVAEKSQEPARARGNKAKSPAAARMTGKRKTGKSEETHDMDGGSTRHRVGRGVV